MYDPLLNDAGYKSWLTKYTAMLQDDSKAATGDQVNAILADALIELANIVKGSTTVLKALQQYTSASAVYFAARDTALSTILYGTTFSLEYDGNRPANQVPQSTAKFILGSRLDTKSGNIVQLTGNASVTLYNGLQGSSVGRVRSAQAAFEADYPVTKTTDKLQIDADGGYYFQYMAANGLLSLPASALAPGTTIPLPGNASVLLNTKGPIHIGQGKITFSIKGTSIKVPLAITVASRTDLIKASG